ncbi:MAG: hypothetical protein JWQ41_3417 [Variovorax sp.]|nr:hypothetical protein [Variovorax sp.]
MPFGLMRHLPFWLMRHIPFGLSLSKPCPAFDKLRPNGRRWLNPDGLEMLSHGGWEWLGLKGRKRLRLMSCRL